MWFSTDPAPPRGGGLASPSQKAQGRSGGAVKELVAGANAPEARRAVEKVLDGDGAQATPRRMPSRPVGANQARYSVVTSRGALVRKERPVSSSTWAWCSNRSIAALARSGSPNRGCISSTARFEVTIIEVRS